MQKPKKTRPKSSRDTFRPYAVKIGEIVYLWNQLHHNLCGIFAHVVRSRSKTMSAAIWHSTDNDTAQRKMLRSAVAQAAFLKEEQREAINWVLNEIDGSLRHKRNDALHAPYGFLFGDGEYEVSLETDFKNPRALSLFKKQNLYRELKEYSAFAEAIGLYAFDVWQALKRAKTVSLPKKPVLPHAHRKKSREATPRRSIAK